MLASSKFFGSSLRTTRLFFHSLRSYSSGFCTSKKGLECSEQQAYLQKRRKAMERFQYPDFKSSLTLKGFHQKYQKQAIDPSQREQQIVQKVAGRVTAIRTHGKTTFIDIREQHLRLQVVTTLKTPSSQQIKRGDIIGVSGKPFTTKTGELSILTEEPRILAPCLWMLPDYGALKDHETRYRQRSLDMLVNSSSMEIIIKRSRIVSAIRDSLISEDYMEVETPNLSVSAGGAIAKPFTTYHNEHKMDLYLRVAPELYLKRLLVGGLTRVFEIGRNFRNEGIDQTHNPEFTSCELYCAYADYSDMMDFTHRLLNRVVRAVNNGSSVLRLPQDQTHQQYVDIDISKQWQRKDFMEGLEKELNRKLPTDFEQQSTIEFYDNLCRDHRINCEEPRTIARLLDKLSGRFLENSIQPFMIVNHPKVLSPLAKPHPCSPHLTQRFQLFINGWELVNSYTELNSPVIQKQNTPGEQDYIQSLEYGLMPCAGWGIGIDRLVMLLTGATRIQEVLCFPLMKEKETSPEERQS